MVPFTISHYWPRENSVIPDLLAVSMSNMATGLSKTGCGKKRVLTLKGESKSLKKLVMPASILYIQILLNSNQS